MKCPIKHHEFPVDGHTTDCDADCAWLMTDVDDHSKACAVAVIAQNVGIQPNDGDENNYAIENEVEGDE